MINGDIINEILIVLDGKPNKNRLAGLFKCFWKLGRHLLLVSLFNIIKCRITYLLINYLVIPFA